MGGCRRGQGDAMSGVSSGSTLREWSGRDVNGAVGGLSRISFVWFSGGRTHEL